MTFILIGRLGLREGRKEDGRNLRVHPIGMMFEFDYHPDRYTCMLPLTAKEHEFKVLTARIYISLHDPCI